MKLKMISTIWDFFILVFFIGLILMRFIPPLFGYMPVVCESNSMVPVFAKDSLCFVDTKYDAEAVKKGDILAFELSDGSLVTHRAHAITDNGIITKGDANSDPDFAPVRQEQIIGETVLYIPKIGKLFYTFPNLVLIGITIFFIQIKLIIDLLEYLKEKKR